MRRRNPLCGLRQNRKASGEGLVRLQQRPKGGSESPRVKEGCERACQCPKGGSESPRVEEGCEGACQCPSCEGDDAARRFVHFLGASSAGLADFSPSQLPSFLHRHPPATRRPHNPSPPPSPFLPTSPPSTGPPAPPFPPPQLPQRLPPLPTRPSSSPHPSFPRTWTSTTPSATCRTQILTPFPSLPTHHSVPLPTPHSPTPHSAPTLPSPTRHRPATHP